ncbi:MAG: ABC transporter ATP-binding protein [Lachnospiraceae bacterium]|nr:ABC transporter ATP-binding protein [Lachnospiraceae bacterium]
MLEVINLTKRYGSNTAVDNLSFKIESGRIYGFLGPNGAGKSTTMNMITGYLAPSEGTVLIDGHDILKSPIEAKKHIGYLPEIPPLYMDMTVREYLDFVADLKKIPKKDKPAMMMDVMDKTRVADVADRLIKNLSKGYKQRVGIAEALMGYPDIIILDEPTVGLDPKQIIEIRELIKSLGEKHTVILSSHILQEISAVCDHIMVISHGKLVASDTAENLANSMSDTHTMHLVVRASETEVKEALNGIEGIEELRFEASEERGVAKAVITSKVSVDIREKVFGRMADRKLPVLDMHSDNLSLEDVYLRLTGSSNYSAEKTSEENLGEEAEEK